MSSLLARQNPDSTNQWYDKCACAFDGRGCPMTNDSVQAHRFPPSSTPGEPGKAQQGKMAIIAFLTHEDHELWRSFPRVGKRLAPRRLSEWGDDRHRYADAKSVQTLAGTAPVPFQSGKYAKAHQRFACVKPLRDDLQQFAWQSTLSEPWAASYYQRKLAEGKTRSMAVRALANVWVRIIYRVWQNKTSYQAEVFEAAQQAHAKRAA